MPRVRWRSVTVLCLILNCFWITSVNADCWFENLRYEEENEVRTSESCLNCTCRQGAIVCYLRVCSEMPDPPPPGCVVLHRRRSCCPELICTDIPSGNGIEARSEPDEPAVDYYNNRESLRNACLENGTIYAPGSAMGSSTFCQYCYCIAGKQTCIKPKCLLDLEGCVPQFEPHTCCPSRYNCVGHYNSIGTTSTTTSTTTKDVIARGGCIVSRAYYSEGSRVLGVGHSICDNCYCVRGMLRCEPLSCAPAIFGCLPVIKPGECCPGSYNCNGTIEIQPPELNYGNHPTVSKEYAKLRKEAQQPSPTRNYFSDKLEAVNKTETYYVIAETSATTKTHRNSESFGTTRQFLDPSTRGPFYYSTMTSPKVFPSTNPYSLLDIRTRPSTVFKNNNITYGTTNYQFQNTSYKRPLSVSTNAPKAILTTPKQLRSSDDEDDAILDLVDSLFDNEINKKQTNGSTEEFVTFSPDELTTSITTEATTAANAFNPTDFISTTLEPDDLTVPVSDDTKTTGLEGESTTELGKTTRVPWEAVTALVTRTVCENTNETTTDQQLNSTEAHEINNELEGSFFRSSSTGNGETSTVSAPDITEVDLESKLKVDAVTVHPLKRKPTEIEAIVKSKDYDDYDYNEPTLPPSLPNLRIIPFVAADALDTQQLDKQNGVFPFARERVTEQSTYHLFSPPTKTEGGFVPKEPSNPHQYFDNFRTTGVDITSSAPTVTNTVKSHKHNCIKDGLEIAHGATITAEGCIICVCFYGNIVCQQPQCPSPDTVCKTHEKSACCPQIICDEADEVIERMDVTSSPEDIVTMGESLRNVIKTEAFLAASYSSTLQSGTETTTETEKPHENETNELSFSKVLELLFYGETTTTEKVKVVKATHQGLIMSTSTNHPNSVDSSSASSGVGLLKLAGCNIYGRMYRVGRIIAELSGPCLECKCTEVGVQCTPLKC